jgi:hypothetical protein
MNIHTLILPDIHGRSFWKEAIQKFPINDYPNLNIVFLGDYLDPYEFEGITRKQAIENFKEILKVAKEDNRIHLLIGNHDMHYWFDAQHKSRIDTNPKNFKIIKDLFLQNFTLFNIAYEETINNERYLYTHAGVTSYWLSHLHFVGKNCLGRFKENRHEFCNMLMNMTPTADELNKMKLDFQGQSLLWAASWIRGGDDNCGSCLWADYEEWTFEDSNIGFWQIFGHTLCAYGFDEGCVDKEKKIAMLDSRQAWVLTNDNEILKLKDYK